MIKVAKVIRRVNTQLADTRWLRWPLVELCDYFNDAIRAVILARPDAGAVSLRLKCVRESRQEIPADVLRLLQLTRVTYGNALMPIPRDVLSVQYPNWHSVSGTPERYVYSEMTPHEYYLFPFPDRAMTVEAVGVKIPPEVQLNSLEDVIEVAIDDVYINPLVDWMLYRAFSKDAAGGARTELDARHYRAFAEQMGVKQTVDIFMEALRRRQYTGEVNG